MKVKDLKKVEQGLEREVQGDYGVYKVYDTNDEVTEMLKEIMEGKTENDTVSLKDITQIREMLMHMTNVLDVRPDLNDLDKLQIELGSRNMKRVIKKVGILLSEDMCDIIEEISSKNRLVETITKLPSNITQKMMEKLELDKAEREEEISPK